MRKIITGGVLFFLIIFAAQSAFAQGETAVPFLLITPGARNSAMGEAGAALPNDATAIFWNPAGLAFQYEDPEEDKRNEISVMHTQWLPQFNFSDLYYDYLAARFYMEDIGMLGASITFLNLGENVWTDETGQTLGTFDSFEYAISLAYATKLQDNLGIGVNAKIIQSNLSDKNPGTENKDGKATTFAVDLGVLWTPAYDFLDNRLNIGFNLSNFGPKVTYIDKAQADPLPTNFRLGFAVKVFDDLFNKVIVTYDINRLLVYKYKDGTSDNVFKSAFYSSWVKGTFNERMKRFTHAMGLEYSYGSLISLRAGFFYEDPNFGDRKFATFGGGIGFNIFQIDFSYISTEIFGREDHPLGGTLRYSIAVKF